MTYARGYSDGRSVESVVESVWLVYQHPIYGFAVLQPLLSGLRCVVMVFRPRQYLSFWCLRFFIYLLETSCVTHGAYCAGVYIFPSCVDSVYAHENIVANSDGSQVADTARFLRLLPHNRMSLYRISATNYNTGLLYAYSIRVTNATCESYKYKAIMA